MVVFFLLPFLFFLPQTLSSLIGPKTSGSPLIPYQKTMGKNTTNLMLGLALLLLISNSLTKGVLTAIMEPRPAGTTEYRPAEDGRRVLAPFQLCLDCRCCAANDASNCTTMPCCFGIDCNLPDKPFGVCAFVPKTCNCTSCGQ